MTLSIAGRPLGQCWASLWYRVRLPLFASPFYRAMLSGPPAFQLSVVPPDPWAGDADRGAAILGGTFPFAHSVETAEGEAVWDVAGAPPAWRDELHSFQWLADLRTVGGAPARRCARELIAGWCKRYGWWHPVAWRPAVLVRRVAAWFGHYEFCAASADDEVRARFFRALLRQLRHLDRIGGAVGGPMEQLIAAKVQIIAGIALPDDGDRLGKGLRRLSQILARDFLGDGGYAARAPATQVEVLRHLVDIRAALGAASRSIPDALQGAIDRLAGVVRFLRHGDGGLALFHDGNEEEGWRIDTVLAQAVARAGMLPRLTDTGFERLQSGRSIVIVDVGWPPVLGHDRRAHASALAFEMSFGKERLVVNMGAASQGQAEWRNLQRASAAHSTLIVADTNSVPLRRGGGFGKIAGTVEARREDLDGAVLVDARHDFYRRRFGLVHRRRLFLALGGEDLRGEDTLDGPAGRAFAIRFHLHPDVRVSLLQGGGALLRLPGGSFWRMRAGGGELAIADSVYFGHGGEMKRTQQVVISGVTQDGGETVIKWALQREGKPAPRKGEAP